MLSKYLTENLSKTRITLHIHIKWSQNSSKMQYQHKINKVNKIYIIYNKFIKIVAVTSPYHITYR